MPDTKEQKGAGRKRVPRKHRSVPRNGSSRDCTKRLLEHGFPSPCHSSASTRRKCGATVACCCLLLEVQQSAENLPARTPRRSAPSPAVLDAKLHKGGALGATAAADATIAVAKVVVLPHKEKQRGSRSSSTKRPQKHEQSTLTESIQARQKAERDIHEKAQRGPRLPMR